MGDGPSKPRLTVIEGIPAPDTAREKLFKRLRAQPKPGHILRCRRCTGIALIEVKLGVEFYNNKPRGGQKQLICATCLLNGETVVIY